MADAVAHRGRTRLADQRPHRHRLPRRQRPRPAPRRRGRGYPTGRWATYRQWEQIGAQVRKGERATPAVNWSPTVPAPTPPRPTDSADGDDTATRLIPVGFALFNAAQVDSDPHVATDTEPADTTMTDERFAGWLAPIPAHVIWGGNSAYYSPATDTSTSPPGQFTDPDAIGATVAHELAHWTGHPDRLARDLTGRFGDDLRRRGTRRRALRRIHLRHPRPGRRRPQRRPRRLPRLVVPVLHAEPAVLWSVASKAQAATDHLHAYSTSTVLEVAS